MTRVRGSVRLSSEMRPENWKHVADRSGDEIGIAPLRIKAPPRAPLCRPTTPADLEAAQGFADRRPADPECFRASSRSGGSLSPGRSDPAAIFAADLFADFSNTRLVRIGAKPRAVTGLSPGLGVLVRKAAARRASWPGSASSRRSSFSWSQVCHLIRTRHRLRATHPLYQPFADGQQNRTSLTGLGTKCISMVCPCDKAVGLRGSGDAGAASRTESKLRQGTARLQIGATSKLSGGEKTSWAERCCSKVPAGRLPDGLVAASSPRRSRTGSCSVASTPSFAVGLTMTFGVAADRQFRAFCDLSRGRAVPTYLGRDLARARSVICRSFSCCR